MYTKIQSITMESIAKTVIIIALFINFALSQLIVELDTGKIQGRTDVTSNNKLFYAFQEIPYAEAPVGSLRFQPPQPIQNWEGVLNTTKNTKVCYQVPFDDPLENEDCLYLNVYTPVAPGSLASKSVLFFIHGGGFVQGSGVYDLYGPQTFIENDLVVVTINYRLGPFGFLSTGDTVVPGNNGLWDQNFALQWVNRNIHRFGGNPSQVTIMGQSAGAASVAHHVISERSRGLFRAAIQISGSSLSPWSYQRNAANYSVLTTSYISNFISNLNNPTLLKLYLQTVTAKTLDEASAKIPEGFGSDQLIEGYFFAPVIEPNHPNAFITERMYKSYEDGNFAKVPIFMGLTSEEGLNRYIASGFDATVAKYDQNVGYLAIDDLHIEDEQTKKECGEAIRKIYTNGTLGEDLRNAIRYFSDVSFTKAIIRQAQLQSKQTDVYFYQFSYIYKLVTGQRISTGVFHGEDLFYIWYNPTITSIILNSNKDNRQAAERYAKLMSNFVKNLNPTPSADPELQNVILPKISANYFPYLDIDDNLTVATNPKHDVVEGWNNIYERYGVKPFDTY